MVRIAVAPLRYGRATVFNALPRTKAEVPKRDILSWLISDVRLEKYSPGQFRKLMIRLTSRISKIAFGGCFSKCLVKFPHQLLEAGSDCYGVTKGTGVGRIRSPADINRSKCVILMNRTFLDLRDFGKLEFLITTLTHEMLHCWGFFHGETWHKEYEADGEHPRPFNQTVERIDRLISPSLLRATRDRSHIIPEKRTVW